MSLPTPVVDDEGDAEADDMEEAPTAGAGTATPLISS